MKKNAFTWRDVHVKSKNSRPQEFSLPYPEQQEPQKDFFVLSQCPSKPSGHSDSVKTTERNTIPLF